MALGWDDEVFADDDFEQDQDLENIQNIKSQFDKEILKQGNELKMPVFKDKIKFPEYTTLKLRTDPIPPMLFYRFHYHATFKMPKVDRQKYPHDCPKCGKPAYIGFSSVDCSNCK